MSFLFHQVFYLFLCALFLVLVSQAQLGRCELSLTLLHTNDVHSRFEQVDTYGQPCSKKDAAANKCFAGFARLYQKAEEIRKSHPNVIYLSGGDFYQGTVWYTLFKWEVVAHFVNKLNHTAMALGNHEFDDNMDGLVPFLNNASFPILSCNIDDTGEPKIQGKYNKSVIVEYEGVKVGIIGYTTPETKDISNPGKLIFKNITESVTQEAKRLYEQENVRILVAVGHAGFEVDLELAKIPYLDFIVGGHTNTFLYTGKPPSVETPEGQYPTIVTQTSGKRVPVVQAYAYGKYLGYLNLKFDNDGELTEWEGNPILLDSSVPQDKDVLADVSEWSKKVAEKVETEIGRTKVFLDGTRASCRLGECNLGNVITDAMVFMNMKDDPNGYWTDVSMAIVHAGSIRASISERTKNGSITLGDLLLVSPFGHTVDTIEIEGKYLRQTFEFAVQGFDPKSDDPSGKFLQISGIRVVYDITKPNGSRVKRIDVLCQKCRVPTYVPLDDKERYKLVVPGYLVEGGNGYAVLKNYTLVHMTSGQLDLDILIPYLYSKSPIIQGVEGRITFETDEVVAKKCNASVNLPNRTSQSALNKMPTSTSDLVVPQTNRTRLSKDELKLRRKIQSYIKQLEKLQNQEAGLTPIDDNNNELIPHENKTTTSSTTSSEESNEEQLQNLNSRRRRSIILDRMIRTNS